MKSIGSRMPAGVAALVATVAVLAASGSGSSLQGGPVASSSMRAVVAAVLHPIPLSLMQAWRGR